jgi:hypothetical protein
LTAENYFNSETGCSGVNMNDQVGRIHIYNGKQNMIKTTGTYTVLVFFKVGAEAGPF